MNSNSQYLAIKVKGLSFWLWFKREKTKRETGIFSGTDGWGEDGARTDIDVCEELIEGEITSDTPQHDS